MMPPGRISLRKPIAMLGWLLLAGIVLATLAPLDLRPHLLAFGPTVERFGAFALLAFCITLAYPRWRWPILLVGLVLVTMLELGQFVTASRHGRLSDILVKSAGYIVGFLMASMLDSILRHRHRHRAGSR